MQLSEDYKAYANRYKLQSSSSSAKFSIHSSALTDWLITVIRSTYTLLFLSCLGEYIARYLSASHAFSRRRIYLQVVYPRPESYGRKWKQSKLYMHTRSWLDTSHTLDKRALTRWQLGLSRVRQCASHRGVIQLSGLGCFYLMLLARLF